MTFYKIHKWVRLERVRDYLQLGWLALPSLEGTGHGHWSAHLAWCCDCPVTEPRK